MEEIIRNGKETLIYSIAQPEDLEDVMLMAAESLISSGPLKEIDSIAKKHCHSYSNQAGNDGNNDGGLLAIRKNLFQKCFAHPTSIIVREKSSGSVVGFLAMLIEDRTSSPSQQYSNTNEELLRRFPAMWLYLAIDEELERGIDLYERYKTDRILYWQIGTVRKDYQGERVLKSTTFRTLWEKIARENGVGAMKAHAYNSFAALGKHWETIKSIEYNSFQLPDGRRPLAGIDFGVHKNVRLVAARIPIISTVSEDQKQQEKLNNVSNVSLSKL